VSSRILAGHAPDVLSRMEANAGRFKNGERRSPATEFKKGEHWRPHQRFREKDYLEREYVECKRSAAEIAAEWGVHCNAIMFWLTRHGIPRRSMSEARAVKKWGARGVANPMYGKRGAQVPSWKGGVTPERQAFNSSLEWKAVSVAVYERDRDTCQRCGKRWGRRGRRFPIHHIVPFAVVALRADPGNLLVLCTKCHGFVHSRKNINRDYLG
jgi:5-methylcytosine-specific restriction enzyme A